MNEAIKQLLINVVRMGLVWLLGAIAAHYPAIYHFVNDWVTSNGGVAVLAVSIAGTLFLVLQSFYTRMRMRLFAKQALRAEPGTTLTNIDKQVAAAPISAIITADPTKIPE